MGLRGPKATSSEILRARGGWRVKSHEAKQSIAGITPPPLSKPPRAARWMGRKAQREYRLMAPLLWQLGKLTRETKDWWYYFFSLVADYKEIEAQLADLLGGGRQGELFADESKIDVLKMKRLLSLKMELGRQIRSSLREAGLSPNDLELLRPQPENPRTKFFADKPKPGDNRGA